MQRREHRHFHPVSGRFVASAEGFRTPCKRRLRGKGSSIFTCHSAPCTSPKTGCRQRPVKHTPRSQRNECFASGLRSFQRRPFCRRAFRPKAASHGRERYVRFTSTPAVHFAQTPAVRRPLGEWVKSTQGDIGADTATVHCDPNSEHSVRQGELVLTERAFLLRRSPESRGPI
jgi:hypothetical protein